MKFFNDYATQIQIDEMTDGRDWVNDSDDEDDDDEFDD